MTTTGAATVPLAETLLAPFIRAEERRYPTATSCDGALAVPGLKEFFVGHVSDVLRRPDHPSQPAAS